jgi:hypothetical protein
MSIMKSNIVYILFILTGFLATPIFAQQNSMDSITRKFRDYRETNMQEKLFVHTDQEFYLTGELLWFRVFCVDGSLHKISTTSTVAFVEIIDRNNIPLVQSKVSLDENGGQGSLFLPATMISGNYLIKVYTQWMRNFSPDFFFQKQITVVNPFTRMELPPGKVIPKTLVEFFPEGGNLVSGISSRIAFKASRSDGQWLDGEGAVIRNNTDTVAVFRPHKFGLGSFFLTPGIQDDYKCVFKDVEGNISSHDLPKINAEGYVMQLSDSTSGILKVKVRYNGEVQALKYSYLFVHARQSIVLAEAKPIYPSEAVYSISIKDLPEGISHFTVFDDQQRPVCERLYFKAPATRLAITLNTDQTSYTTRRKVSLEVSTSAAGKQMAADVSLSVFRVDSLSADTPQDILSYLYLQSDLAGRIESPAYYFSGEPGSAAAADNLMLTHGWRRFKWDDILQRRDNITFIPEVRSHLITGKVTKADGTPVPGVLTYLSSPGKLVNIYGARSNKDGLVHFEVRDFWGPRQLILQTNTSQDSTYLLSLSNPYHESRSSYTLKPFVLSQNAHDKLSARSLSMQVQDIYFRDVYDRIATVKNDSTGFFGQPDETYNLDDYTRFPVMEEVMREYVPGVIVRKRKDGFHFLVLDRVSKGILTGDPMVILDGMPVFDVDKIMAFDPLKIKKLEVVTRNYYLGPLLLNGIVSYSTYQGNLAGFPLDPRSVSINYEGLQLQRELYSPVYESQKQRNHRLPDQRILLHWEPVCKTGKDGKTTVHFYTSDAAGDFIVVAEGLAARGVAGSGVYKFTVKRSDF